MGYSCCVLVSTHRCDNALVKTPDDGQPRHSFQGHCLVVELSLSASLSVRLQQHVPDLSIQLSQHGRYRPRRGCNFPAVNASLALQE